MISKQCPEIINCNKVVNNEKLIILDKCNASKSEIELPFSQLDILSQANSEYEYKYPVTINKPSKLKNDENVLKNNLSYEEIIEVLRYFLI